MANMNLKDALERSLLATKEYIDKNKFSGDYNDLENKPCYEISELKLFTNDGDNTGRLIVNKGTTNIKFAKISEDEIDFNSIDQARFSIVTEYESHEMADPSTFIIVENETGSAISLGEYVICTFNDNFAMDISGTTVTFPEKGLYFSFNAHSLHLWHLDNVYLPVTSIKQLDEKFIPDTIARVENLPCYDTRVFENITIEYDGVTDGRVVASMPVLGCSNAVKVADITEEQLAVYATAFETNGYTITIDNGDGTTTEKTGIGYYTFAYGSIFIPASPASVILVPRTFSLESGHTSNYATEPGIYFSATDTNKVLKLQFNCTIDGELKIIEPKYLVNSPGIKLENNAEIFNDYNENIATGDYSHAEGKSTEATGDCSHAEGNNTLASGAYSHAEGNSTEATGRCSHAEGNNTEATGDYSHAEGSSTEATGNYSHAEGDCTKASGENSHAEGRYTVAEGDYQHVQGKFNIPDPDGKYAHIVGNGSYKLGGHNVSNAHTLDWDGNAWFAGNITLGTDNNEVATKDYVDDNLSLFADSGMIKMSSIDGSSGQLLVAHRPSNGPNNVFYSTKAYITSTGSIGTEANINAKAFYEDSVALADKYATKGYVDEAVANATPAIITEEDINAIIADIDN